MRRRRPVVVEPEDIESLATGLRGALEFCAEYDGNVSSELSRFPGSKIHLEAVDPQMIESRDLLEEATEALAATADPEAAPQTERLRIRREMVAVLQRAWIRYRECHDELRRRVMDDFPDAGACFDEFEHELMALTVLVPHLITSLRRLDGGGT